MKELLVILIIIVIILIFISPVLYEKFYTPGIIYSTYNKYDKRIAHRPGLWPGTKKMIIGFHYHKDSPKSKLYMPIWEKIKKDLSNQYIIFVENDESIKKTKGIIDYPTIIKYQDGIGDIYNGFADYEKLKTWILKTNHDRLYYFPYK